MIAEGFDDIPSRVPYEDDMPGPDDTAITENVLICRLWSSKQSGRPTVEGQFCSLHVNERSAHEFERAYWATTPKEAPDTFACPAEDSDYREKPLYRCRVDAATFKRVYDSGHGLWSTTVPHPTTEAISMIPPKDFMSLTEGAM